MKTEEETKGFILALKADNPKYDWMVKYYDYIRQSLDNGAGLRKQYDALFLNGFLDNDFKFSSFRNYFYMIKAEKEIKEEETKAKKELEAEKTKSKTKKEKTKQRDETQELSSNDLILEVKRVYKEIHGTELNANNESKSDILQILEMLDDRFKQAKCFNEFKTKITNRGE